MDPNQRISGDGASQVPSETTVSLKNVGEALAKTVPWRSNRGRRTRRSSGRREKPPRSATTVRRFSMRRLTGDTVAPSTFSLVPILAVITGRFLSLHILHSSLEFYFSALTLLEFDFSALPLLEFDFSSLHSFSSSVLF